MKYSLQRGFTIVSAIFILVVLAALGAFVVTVSTNQQIGSALDVQGTQAYQAARSGIEWGLYQVQATPAYNFSYGNTCAAAVGNVHSNLRSCATANGSFTVFGFNVSVTCSCSAGSCSPPAPTAVNAGAFVIGNTYVIRTIGTTNFTLIGSASNCVGKTFTATGVGTGTGTAAPAEPIVFTIVSTACSTAGACPNTSPSGFYVERRLEVTF